MLSQSLPSSSPTRARRRSWAWSVPAASGVRLSERIQINAWDQVAYIIVLIAAHRGDDRLRLEAHPHAADQRPIGCVGNRPSSPPRRAPSLSACSGDIAAARWKVRLVWVRNSEFHATVSPPIAIASSISLLSGTTRLTIPGS